MLIDRYIDEIKNIELEDRYGLIKSINGYKIVSLGPDISKGELCYIKKDNETILCEVVGFDGAKKYLMPYKRIDNIKVNDYVYKLNKNLEIDISEDYLGCVLNGIGEIILDNEKVYKKKDKCYLLNQAPSPIDRGFIDTVFETGIKVIDGLLTIGEGQRIGIFAGSGVGKTTLLSNIIKNNNADINIIALIGERGRELNEFIKILGDNIKNSIIVTATSNETPIMRLKCAYTATSIAEYFRDKGKRVLLVMDSLTRFALAQREIGLNAGEPPVTKGYPPSVFTMLPELLERAGKNEYGSITAIYTVLVEGDDENEIISDTVRGILDGHIVLSRELANRNIFPAVDILKSISRIMNDIVTEEHKIAANNIRNIIRYYRDNEQYLNLMYKKGTDYRIDNIISYYDEIEKYFKQSQEKISFKENINYIINRFYNLNIKI